MGPPHDGGRGGHLTTVGARRGGFRSVCVGFQSSEQDDVRSSEWRADGTGDWWNRRGQGVTQKITSGGLKAPWIRVDQPKTLQICRVAAVDPTKSSSRNNRKEEAGLVSDPPAAPWVGEIGRAHV